MHCIRRRFARVWPHEQRRDGQQGCETPRQGGDGAEVQVDRRACGPADHTDALHRNRRTGECRSSDKKAMKRACYVGDSLNSEI